VILRSGGDPLSLVPLVRSRYLRWIQTLSLFDIYPLNVVIKQFG